MSDVSTADCRKRTCRLLRLALRCSVSVLLLYGLFRSIDFSRLLQILKNAAPFPLVLALAGVVLSVAVSTWKWRILLEAQQISVSGLTAWRSYWAGLFLNNFLPGGMGMDAFRALHIGRLKSDVAGSVLSVFLERMYALCGLGLTGLCAAFLLEEQTAFRWLPWLFGGLAVLGLTIPVYLCFFMGRPELQDRAERGKLKKFWRAFRLGGQAYRGRIDIVLVSVLGGLLFQACVVFVNIFIFAALGGGVPWRAAFVYIPAVSAASMIPLTINGFGVREGAYAVFFASLLSEETALASSLIFAFGVTLCSLFGGALLLLYGKDLQNTPGEAKARS